MAAAPGQIFKSIDWRLFRSRLELPCRPNALKVKELSDIYVSEKGSPEVWDDNGFVQAYLDYFFPLNLMRALFTVNWGHEVDFFVGFDRVVEFGSGPGTLQLAFHLSQMDLDWFTNEANPTPLKIHRKLSRTFNFKEPRQSPATATPATTLYAASYTLTETPLPQEAYENEGLFLLEASTKENFYRLDEIRRLLINKGYSIWAPCPHQGQCPLGRSTHGDWCHFRIPAIDLPPWFEDLEQQKLPMRNDTLTFSYLLARRTPSPISQPQLRVIGQTLREKGKTRQLICRGSDREYLSWLLRDGAPPRIPSGTLMNVPNDIIIKGNELRFSKA